MLHERSRDFVGHKLLVKPFYGWGWQRCDDPRPGATAKSIVTVPDLFHARLLELWSWEGELRGGVGRIEEQGHELDGFFVCFSTRHDGIAMLDQLDVHYNVDIGPQESVYTESGWPFPRGVPALHGYATIRVASDDPDRE